MLKESEQKQIKKMFEEIENHNGNIKEATSNYQRTIPDFVLEKMKQVEQYMNECEELKDGTKIERIDFNKENEFMFVSIVVSTPYTRNIYNYPCDMTSKEIFGHLLLDILCSLEQMIIGASDYMHYVRRNIDYLKMMR